MTWLSISKWPNDNDCVIHLLGLSSSICFAVVRGGPIRDCCHGSPPLACLLTFQSLLTLPLVRCIMMSAKMRALSAFLLWQNHHFSTYQDGAHQMQADKLKLRYGLQGVHASTCHQSWPPNVSDKSALKESLGRRGGEGVGGGGGGGGGGSAQLRHHWADGTCNRGQTDSSCWRVLPRQANCSKGCKKDTAFRQVIAAVTLIMEADQRLLAGRCCCRVEPNAEVPDWLFESTGLEMKRMWQTARKAREQDQARCRPCKPLGWIHPY